MKCGSRAALAVSSLLVLGACGSAGSASTAVAPPATVTTTATPSVTPSPAETSPTVEKRIITRSRPIPFRTRRVIDPSLAKGTTRVRSRGVVGRKILTYQVTLTDGLRTGRRLLSKVVSRRPVTRVIAVGTKESPHCDPNYSPCVPIASDVDCAGGSGNGPAYVQGPVRVIGTDIYRLDADGDGIGCDS